MTRVFRLLAVGLILGAAALSARTGAADGPKGAPAKKTIEVAICLDVSGSMGGLIDAAKNKLWDIVNELAKAKPTPDLRVALYSFGHTTYDAAKGWVRKELDLTTDLDELYKKLFALTINGGDEYATRVSRDAIVDQKWTKGKDALRLIFVCGNEPANQDRLVSMKDAADLAKKHGIFINTIYCGGSDDADARSWRELASLADGRFATIDHNKAHVAINTPQDKKLAELGVELNKTYVAYGLKGADKKMNQEAQTSNALFAGAGVAASRTAAQNSALYNCADWDLVDRCKQDKNFDITKVPEKELPEALRKLTVEQRVKYVKDMTSKREQLQKEITTLNTQRTTYINEELRRNPNPAARAFDNAIREALRGQAKTRGIVIPE
jgi:hypothetical protein